MDSTSFCASLLVFALCMCMLKCAISFEERNDRIILQSERRDLVLAAGAHSLLIMWWFDLENLELFWIISFLISLFFPYASKTSRYRGDYVGEKFRPKCDKLIITSAIYLCASLFAFLYDQYAMALICGVTFCGSSLYHRHREMVFFNLDNIFATSLLVVFVYVLCSSYYYHEIVFMLGALGMPVAVFLIVYCGMPADINLQKEIMIGGVCCTRSGRELYDTIHTLWHVASGGGPILAVWYFNYLKQNELLSYVPMYNPYINAMDEVATLDALPYAALFVALCINVMGNYQGIMPLD